MTKREVLKKLIDDFKISQTKIAEMIGMNHNTFRTKLSTNVNDNSFTFKEFNSIDDVLEKLSLGIKNAKLFRYKYCTGVIAVYESVGDSLIPIKFENEDGSVCNISIEEMNKIRDKDIEEKNKAILIAHGGVV